MKVFLMGMILENVILKILKMILDVEEEMRLIFGLKV